MVKFRAKYFTIVLKTMFRPWLHPCINYKFVFKAAYYIFWYGPMTSPRDKNKYKNIYKYIYLNNFKIDSLKGFYPCKENFLGTILFDAYYVFLKLMKL